METILPLVLATLSIKQRCCGLDPGKRGNRKSEIAPKSDPSGKTYGDLPALYAGKLSMNMLRRAPVVGRVSLVIAASAFGEGQ